MIEPLKRAVSAALGTPVRALARTHGGDINDAFEARLEDGRRVFVKTHARADRRMFACEAHGLEWLRAAASGATADAASSAVEGDAADRRAESGANRGADVGALRIPCVLAHSTVDDEGPPFLVLEWIASAPRAADFDEQLGRGLARLHMGSAPSHAFGFSEANFIGSLPQDNTPCESWPAFYVTRRLEPQVRAAIDRGAAPAGWTRAFARLFARMDEIAGPPEPPARLHGDLWGGNVMADERGAPCLIDPAVYAGHREIDLAMLRLFGGLGARSLAAYQEAAPLAPGHEARVALYQLYPLLVHVNLFGGGYVSAVDGALRRYL